MPVHIKQKRKHGGLESTTAIIILLTEIISLSTLNVKQMFDKNTAAADYDSVTHSNQIERIAECKLSDLSELSTDGALCFELVLLRILFVFISCQAACATELLK